MEFTILGSGGNSPTPMPACECRVCVEARAKDVPYARRGNSLFLHDENLLIDTWADVKLLSDGQSWTMGNVEVTHISAPIEAGGPNTISGLLFEDEDATVFVSPDENRHFDLGRLPDLDLWIKETGYFRTDPDGDPLVTDHAEQTGLAHEMTFQESLDQVRTVDPDRVVMTEIEELFRRSYDDYEGLEAEYDSLNVEFAHDGMTIEV